MCGSTFVLSSWDWAHFGTTSLLTLTLYLAITLLKTALVVPSFNTPLDQRSSNPPPFAKESSFVGCVLVTHRLALVGCTLRLALETV